jgi:hypothetical protein
MARQTEVLKTQAVLQVMKFGEKQHERTNGRGSKLQFFFKQDFHSQLFCGTILHKLMVGEDPGSSLAAQTLSLSRNSGGTTSLFTPLTL